MDKKISIIGIGMDGGQTMSREALEAVAAAEVLIGAERVLSYFPGFAEEQLRSYKPEEIAACIEMSRFSSIAVLMSGDTGFFSGTKKLMPLLSKYDVRVYCGISTPVYLASRLGICWQDMHFVSLHGTEANVVRAAASHEKTFFLLGGSETPAKLCQKLTCYGLGAVETIIGVNMSLPEEHIYRGRADEFTELECGRLCCVLVINEHYEKRLMRGISDDSFLRMEGKGEDKRLVPMTKSEIRTVCISKLCPTPEDVCWDVGCGSGSVTVELALSCDRGKVYAIDKNPDAIVLTDQNCHHFQCDNVELVEGEMLEVMNGLPAPDVVFIGGSGGKLKEIIGAVFGKNPHARILFTAVSLETMAGSLNIFEPYGWETEILELAVTRTRRLGGHSLLAAQNPVFIVRNVETKP